MQAICIGGTGLIIHSCKCRYRHSQAIQKGQIRCFYVCICMYRLYKVYFRGQPVLPRNFRLGSGVAALALAFISICKGRFSFIQLTKACSMLRGKGRVRTQDLGDTRRGALTTPPLARYQYLYVCIVSSCMYVWVCIACINLKFLACMCMYMYEWVIHAICVLYLSVCM
jgi:hypothetical protein